MKSNALRSPFFYVGDKYKLMPQLSRLFPDSIESYVEPFAGGGSSFLNTKASKYLINDLDPYVIELHRYLSSFAGRKEEFLQRLFSIADSYGLSCSYRGITAPEELKKKYVKTYYSHFNKEAYTRLKEDYNQDQDLAKLYLLLIYGFNHMIRFNKAGKFNLPVGNVDFNKNVVKAIEDYLKFMETSRVSYFNLDYKDFLKTLNLKKEDYVYLDPPYLISGSEYNKFWDEEKEQELYDVLDELDRKGVRFGITNLVHHKGQTNQLFLDWSKKYTVFNIESNYISFNDNTIKEDSREVFVTNYVKSQT